MSQGRSLREVPDTIRLCKSTLWAPTAFAARVRCHGTSFARWARLKAARGPTTEKLEVQTWPTEASPAEVAWAIALGRGPYASSVESAHGQILIPQRFVFRASLDGRRE